MEWKYNKENNTVERVPLKKSWFRRNWPYVLTAVMVCVLVSLRWLL